MTEPKPKPKYKIEIWMKGTHFPLTQEFLTKENRDEGFEQIKSALENPNKTLIQLPVGLVRKQAIAFVVRKDVQ